ncbi:MAG: energy transducer TonB [Acidobacteriota bacterium]
MKARIKILLSLLVFAGHAFAQQDPILGNYRIHGVVKTPTGEVIPGATFLVKRGDTTRQFSADVNGDIIFGLQPGNFQITASSIYGSEFKMFLKIVEKGVNPDDVALILDPAKYCCQDADGKPFPKPLVLPKPPYPPAARAVRARGEVVVSVKIGTDGKVIAAAADGGHALLRAAAMAAAQGSKGRTRKPEKQL